MKKTAVHTQDQSSELHPQDERHGQQRIWPSHMVSSCSLPLPLTPEVRQSSNLCLQAREGSIFSPFSKCRKVK